MSSLSNSESPPRCLLVGLTLARERHSEQDLSELRALATSAGLTPVGEFYYRRSREHSALFIGPGQADEIALQLEQTPVDVVIFDNELGAVQQRNLNRRWQTAVMDRTELILDIFSARAQSREGKLQVELAQLEHQSARLVRGWTHLERQRGGIGGRGGPGEKQVELDRRMLGARVKRLRRDLEELRRQRANRRRARHRNQTVRIGLVGYTNAGKSTLFNRLTGANTLAQDKLFATLDTLTRKLYLPDFGQVMLSDTVGFVRDLPHSLVDAFKATLEETAEAGLLLHVIDASSMRRRDQIDQVNAVLKEIGADHVPVIEVFNKIDCLTGAPSADVPAAPQALANGIADVGAAHGGVVLLDPRGAGDGADESSHQVNGAAQAATAFQAGGCDSIRRVAVSAHTGVGIADLIAAVTDHVRRLERSQRFLPLDSDCAIVPVPGPSTQTASKW